MLRRIFYVPGVPVSSLTFHAVTPNNLSPPQMNSKRFITSPMKFVRVRFDFRLIKKIPPQQRSLSACKIIQAVLLLKKWTHLKIVSRRPQKSRCQGNVPPKCRASYSFLKFLIFNVLRARPSVRAASNFSMVDVFQFSRAGVPPLIFPFPVCGGWSMHDRSTRAFPRTSPPEIKSFAEGAAMRTSFRDYNLASSLSVFISLRNFGVESETFNGEHSFGKWKVDFAR